MALLDFSIWFNGIFSYFHAEDGVKTLRVEEECPDLSALSGTLRSASSTAPSSPPPPCRSGCTAAGNVQSQGDETAFHNKGTDGQVKTEDSRGSRDLVNLLIVDAVQVQLPSLSLLVWKRAQAREENCPHFKLLL